MLRRLLVLLALLALPALAQAQDFIEYAPAGCSQYVIGTSQDYLKHEASCFDWFVDSVGGADASDGKTPATALKTIAALLGKTISAGQRIGLARGSKWREQLTIAPTNNVTVEAYGTGARPILDASDVVVAGSWSKTGGMTNVYQASVTVDATGVWVNAWENDAYLTRVASAAAADATPGTYFPSADAGAITLYVHATDSGNPAANGKTYEVSIREAALYAGDTGAAVPSGVVIRGIQTQREAGPVGSLYVGIYATVDDCAVNQGGKHNLLIGSGRVSNTTVTDWYWGTSSAVAVDYYTRTTGQAVVFDNVDAISTMPRKVGSGFSGHGSGGGVIYASVTYKDCSVNGVSGAAYQASDTDVLYVINSSTNDVFVGVSVAVPTVITGGMFIADRGLSLAVATTVTATGATFKAYNSGQNPVSLGVAGATVTIANSTIQGTAGADTNYGISVSSDTIAVNVQGTTFTGVERAWSIPTNAAAITSDYNVYTGVEQLADGFVIGGVRKSIAVWRAETGEDLNSTPAP